MNNNQILNNLKALIATIKDLWIWFTDDHLEVLEDKRKGFGFDRDEAEERLSDWRKTQSNNMLTDMYNHGNNDIDQHTNSFGES